MKHLNIKLGMMIFFSVSLIACADSRPSAVAPTPIKYERSFPVQEIAFDQSQLDELAALLDFAVVDDVPDVELWEQQVLNRAQTRLAFTACDNQCKLYVQQLDTDQITEIKGPFLTWRYFVGLTWLTDDVLAFDHPANPHYGTHYQIDVVNQKLVTAGAYTDIIEPTSEE